MARSVPSLRENAPASSSARTFRNPSALPESVAASAFFLRITPYPLRLWIREFFRGSLEESEELAEGWDSAKIVVALAAFPAYTSKVCEQSFLSAPERGGTPSATSRESRLASNRR